MEFAFLYFDSVRYNWSSAISAYRYVMLLILFSIGSVFYFGTASLGHSHIELGSTASSLTVRAHIKLTISLPIFLYLTAETPLSSVADPKPWDPYVLGPPGSISTMYGSGSFYHQAKVLRKSLISYSFVIFYTTFYL
jgi:hypothetical protein